MEDEIDKGPCTREGLRQQLREQYGFLLTVDEVATLLRYPSAAAVRQAHTTGRLPVSLVTLPGRRTLFATTESVVRVLARAESLASRHAEQQTVGEKTMS